VAGGADRRVGCTAEIKVQLTMPIAQAILRRHCPSCVLERFELRHGGDISTVYEMRCAKPAPRVILKVYPEAFHWKLAKEAYVYCLLMR
jgi:hygromycin-B 7''-O-kinase